MSGTCWCRLVPSPPPSPPSQQAAVEERKWYLIGINERADEAEAPCNKGLLKSTLVAVMDEAPLRGLEQMEEMIKLLQILHCIF